MFVQPRVGFKGASYWEPLGIGYLMAVIRENTSLDTEFFSGAFDSDETIVEACENADYVGFSCTTPQMAHALTLMKEIRRRNACAKIVLGGWHATVAPNEAIKNKEIDYVVIGEGENALLDIVKEEKQQSRGIVISRSIKNLDTLPSPDRDGIKVHRHIEVAFRENGKRITSVQGGRGCPFRCTFCGETLMSGGKIRRRRVQSLLDEIERIVDIYKIDLIKFVDPEVNSSKKWIKEFCRAIIERKLNVEFEANVHAALVDYEMLCLMKTSNFQQINVGVETGSPRIMSSISKQTSIEQIRKVFSWSRELGLRRRAYFMLGFPDETIEDIEMTFNLAREIEPDMVGMTMLCPFPGTLYHKKYEGMNIDWSAADEYTNEFHSTGNFTNRELKTIQRRFISEFADSLCYRQAGQRDHLA